jgi:hypothetical protein
MNIRRGAALLAVACFTLLARCAAPVSAGVPSIVNFQGRLTTSDGSPVPDTTQQILYFELYDAPTGGSLLWSEGLGGITVRGGVFSVSLDFSKGFTGSNTLRSALALTPYLEVKLSNGVPMTPRQPFSAVPYASLARNVPDGSISLANLAPGVLEFSNVGGSLSLGQIPGGIVGADPTLTPLASLTESRSARAIAVAGSYAYVAESAPNKLLVIDISQPAAPHVVGSVATGAGPSSVAVSGTHAYVVNKGANTLQVFDVTTPGSPALAGTVATGAEPMDVAVVGSRAYVISNGAKLLQVFDVSSPTAPVAQGSAATDSKPTAVAVSGGYAYVVDFATGSLRIYDVGNPASPTATGSVRAGFSPDDVAISGDFAYVADYAGQALKILNISNPAAPVVMGSLPTSGGAESVAVSGLYAFVGSFNNALQMVNVGASTSPVLTLAAAVDQDVDSVATQGNFVYCTTSNSRLRVFKIATRYTDADEIRFSDGTVQTTAGGSSSGVAGGDLTGMYPNPAIAANAVGSAKLASDAASLVKVSGGALRAAAGNVGIGTTAPAYPLNFDDVTGEKISLWGHTQNHFGIGVQDRLLQIFSDVPQSDIAFGTGSSAAMTELMRIKGTGSVGIGVANPAYKLEVNGDINAKGVVRANGLALTSDARYKENVTPITDGLESILRLQGVAFDWNRDAWREKNFPPGPQLGFIAQDVEKVLPGVVSTDPNGYESVSYTSLVPVLVEAVKTLKADNDNKAAQIAALQRRLDAQQAQISAQQQADAAIDARLKRLETPPAPRP